MLHTFTSANGVPFLARYLAASDRYGIDGCHTADRPMIEFFDQRYPDDALAPFGQFVSRYYVETLRDSYRSERACSGLCLDGGNREWDISRENLTGVLHAFFVIANRGALIQYDDPSAARPYHVYVLGAAQGRYPTYLKAHAQACVLAYLART